MSSRNNVGKNLKQYRKNLHISQEALGDMTGMPQQSICKIEKCQRNISVDTLDKLSSGMGIPTYQLLMEPNTTRQDPYREIEAKNNEHYLSKKESIPNNQNDHP